MENNEFIGSLEAVCRSLISFNLTQELLIPSMENLFQSMPNVCYLTIQTDLIYLDGYAWEKTFNKYFINIKVFRLKMICCLSDRLEEKIDQLLDSFRSYFWIKQHRWFVRCHWSSMNNRCLLYTLPYAFDTFDFNNFSQSKSTNPYELDYSSYNHVNTLNYTQSERNVYEENIISQNQFVNIRHLRIRLPVNEHFWLAVPTLNRLITLTTTINNDLDYSHFQALLDRTPHLYSLTINYPKNFSMTSFNLKSTSIRRLELHSYSIHFNIAECTILANSSLGCQCEVLIISVESRLSILEFINFMSKLRALSVCYRYTTNNQSASSETKEEFIIWLNSILPSKYIYSFIRHSNEIIQINLWIQRRSLIFQEIPSIRNINTSKSRDIFRFCKPS